MVFNPIAETFKTKIIGGSEDHVLRRYVSFNRLGRYDYIVRITSDCPVFQPFLAEQLIREVIDNDFDYGQIQTPDDFPDGLDVEIFKSSLIPALEAHAKTNPNTKEHVTWPIKFDPKFQASKFCLPKDTKYNLPKISIDTVEELKRIQSMKGAFWWLD